MRRVFLSTICEHIDQLGCCDRVIRLHLHAYTMPDLLVLIRLYRLASAVRLGRNRVQRLHHDAGAVIIRVLESFGVTFLVYGLAGLQRLAGLTLRGA